MLALGARDVGRAPIGSHGDPGGLAGHRNPRHDMLQAEIEHADLVAALIGDEGFGSDRRPATKNDRAEPGKASFRLGANHLDASNFFFRLSRPLRYKAVTALMAASSFNSGGGSLFG